MNQPDTSTSANPPSPLLARALQVASDTKFLEVGSGTLAGIATLFRSAFGDRSAIVIADENTLAAAANQVIATLRLAGVPCRAAHVIRDPHLHAEFRFIDELDAAMKGHDAIPVAVGSGTINDLVKLAAHRAGRQYLAVATAASMDGYTAFGASITKQGSKQTFTCPAPRAVLADLDVITRAPAQMSAAGYADLLAKITAGADWIVADALAVEPIDATSWDLVQSHLRDWSASAEGIPAGDPTALRGLVEGLMMTGFAMQWSKSSRPASGAEHQFSHLWDMQHHIHHGHAPSHGFKVGIATLAVTYLYDFLLQQDLTRIDIDRLVQRWPASIDDAVGEARSYFNISELADKAAEETSAKFITPLQLWDHLKVLTQSAAELQLRLKRQLIPAAKLREMLRLAGAPVDPEQIGISRRRLRDSFSQAYFIRRRYTALDLAVRAGFLDAALDHLFGPAGPWPIE